MAITADNGSAHKNSHARMKASPPSHPTTGRHRNVARATALAVLMTIFRQRRFADDVLAAALERSKVTEQDRVLVHELVYGVLRHCSTLDWRLDRVANHPMDRLPLVVALILRLAAYQMLYLDRIPVSAAVCEAVDLARRVRGRDWRGFVNAVLRALAHHPAPPWPDSTADPCGALSIRYACPRWIVERWLARWGPDGAQALCRKTVQIPPVTIRTNTLRCTREALAQHFREQGHAVQETIVSPVGLVLERHAPLFQSEAWQAGWCYVEDEAAQIIPLLLDVQPGHRILDMCAAPGGKTTHLAQLAGNTGTIVAVDRTPHRLDRLVQNCRRLGITNVLPLCFDLATDQGAESSPVPRERSENTSPQALDEGFDRILLDAPCTGFGVLRRHPEGKWLKTPDLIPQVRHLQENLLERAARLLRPEGILVYSACSTEPEETHEVIETFLRRHPEFWEESVEPWLPAAGRSLSDQAGRLFTPFSSRDMDGFFAARLRKVR